MKKLSGFLLLIFIFSIGYSQELVYKNAAQSWNEDSLGNYRVVVNFEAAGAVAKVYIPWRRRDDSAAQKRIIVQDGRTQQLIANVVTRDITAEGGEVFFEPVSGRGTYYIYYMPYKNEGRANYPKGVYLSAVETASNQWAATVNYKAPVNAEVVAIEAINEFSSNYPMEVVATKTEMDVLLRKHRAAAFLVFPESRELPVRMREKIPYRWIKSGPSLSFNGQAARGEYYSFQLAIYALKSLKDITISFSDLKAASGETISKAHLSCLNTTGLEYDGQQFSQKVQVPTQMVQSMWVLLQVPATVRGGTYAGHALIHSRGNKDVVVTISIAVEDRLSDNGGIGEPWKQTRLHWLNSAMAQNNTVLAPYTPLEVKGNSISLLGRKLTLQQNGLPAQVESFFSKEMTEITTSPENVFAAPVQFNITKDGESSASDWKNETFRFTAQTPGAVSWQASSSIGEVRMSVDASLEFDGFAQYRVKLTALKDVRLADIAMVLPFTADAARYMMGLGLKGGYRPADYNWSWNVTQKNQDGAWLGNVNKGLQFSLRDEHYSRPLNTNFYLQKPLILPSSWGNQNKGGIEIREVSNKVLVNSYSGSRVMKKGDSLFYNFTLLLTPFHPLNTDFQWNTRFYHKYAPVSEVKASGATVINLHHANKINPWINYPFIEWQAMKSYIDSAHALGLKVKIYNTVREVSNRAYETFPMRSLGHEIYSAGPGGGYSWLQEHLGSDYIAAWFVPGIKDAAIINSGMSRWHNYYVEGMNWLVNNVGIDGIYLDDVAFDRITMKRIKRVLTENEHPGIIDLHSANQYNKRDGYNNSANLYMEHFPYINRLWFGEYFDYENNSPDFFLTEVSGIPFGLMGEMLEKGGNPWRGMVYGMTNRMPYDGNDPGGLWKVWDEFGIQDSKMVGYWSDKCPVKTNNSNVIATVYKKDKAALVAIASWDSTDVHTRLKIDWTQLGISPNKAIIRQPFIKELQTEAVLPLNDEVMIEKGHGKIIVISEE